MHIIDNLNFGGAEKMLVTVCKELSEYNNIIVTLTKENAFEEDLQCYKYICLNMKPRLSSLAAAIKLRWVINKYNPDIVHSHLYWPTLIARMATPKAIPLINTIHTFPASSVDYKRWYMRFIDRLSYRFSRSIIVAVAKGSLEEYFDMIKRVPRNAYVLYTFVDVKIFKRKTITSPIASDAIRLISIGSLKEQKNQQYLIEAFKQLKENNIELHIYGEGPLRGKLESSLEQNGIKNIVLKGMVKNIHQVIDEYDLFVMSSTYEGFSLATLEAMALNMPMLLSDIASFKEQCADTAEYFNLADPVDFVVRLKELLSDKTKLERLGNNASKRVLDNFTLAHHMQGLRSIYTSALKKYHN